MKNSKNIIATMTMIVLLSIVSCQKEDLNDYTFSNENVTERLAFDANSSNFDAPETDGNCINFEQYGEGYAASTVLTSNETIEVNVKGTHSVNPSLNAAMVFSYASGEKYLGIAEPPFSQGETVPEAGSLTFDLGSGPAIYVSSISVTGIKAFNSHPYVALYTASGFLGRERLPVTPIGQSTAIDLTRLNPRGEAIERMDVVFNGVGGIDDICLVEVGLPTPQSCVQTMTHWYTFSSDPAFIDMLPITMGNGVAVNSYSYALGTPTSFRDRVDDLEIARTNGNGLAELQYELLLVKLNIANDADASSISAIASIADVWVDKLDLGDWERLDDLTKREARGIANLLGEYNDGNLGVPKCQQQ
ncbi:MAG: hypothetical protein HKN75_08650 [Bacteroidia bacterium]|nr:hypothetical protein [Bacteroidia bacterium]